MSHFTKVETKIRNLSAFEKAAGTIGLTRNETGVVPGWRGATKKFAHAFVDSKKGIGLVENSDKSFAMEADWYLFASNTKNKVMEAYSTNVAQEYVQTLEAQGFAVTTTTENGELVMNAVRY